MLIICFSIVAVFYQAGDNTNQTRNSEAYKLLIRLQIQYDLNISSVFI